MEDNEIRSFVTADREIPETSSEDIRKAIVRERVKHAGDVKKLFILGIITLITSVFHNGSISEYLGFFGIIASLVSVVCSIVLITVHLRMGKTIEEYKTAAICSIVAVVITVVAFVADIILGIAALIELYAIYKEFMGHSELLSGIDDDFSEKWKTLWNWTIFTYIAIIVSVFLGLMFPVLGIIVILAFGIANIVVTVIKVVYQKRMADLFADLEKECALWDKEEKEHIEAIEE